MFDLKKYNILEIYSLFFQNIFKCKFNKDLCLGVFYMTIHSIYVTLVIYNSLFTFNFVNTCILIIIIYLNAITVFLIRTCPLLLLEKHYTNTTCLNSILLNKKNDKEKKEKKKKKILSKYLDYELDEFTLQGLLTLGIILVMKIMIMFIFY
jgi:hypothetical protein